MNIENNEAIKSKTAEDSPEETGVRLQLVRNFAKLSRRELCEKSGLNLNTYKGWEQARFGGLSQKGAEKIIAGLHSIGVACSLDWLLKGSGSPPYFLEESLISTSQQLDISRELIDFEKIYEGGIFLRITDDGMHPIYEEGDFVAGIKVDNENIHSALNKNCIIKIKNGLSTVRYLRKSKKEKYFFLIPININSEDPIGIETEIDFAAPILRHYTNHDIK